MNKIAFAALALMVLAGCGQAPGTAKAPKKAAATKAAPAAAKSAAAIAEKGTLGLFKLAHAHLDADGDGALNPEELAKAAEDEVIPGLPAFKAIDKNGDGAITLAEFTAKELLKGKVALFTERAVAEFQGLDANKDKALTKAEMAESDVTHAAADADKNGKVTQKEFDAALAEALASPKN